MNLITIREAIIAHIFAYEDVNETNIISLLRQHTDRVERSMRATGTWLDLDEKVTDDEATIVITRAFHSER